MLSVSQIWKDRVPDMYQSYLDLDPYPEGECPPNAKAILLLPSHIKQNQPLHVALYGCWEKGDYLGCPFGYFREMVVDAKNAHLLRIHLEKSVTRDTPCSGSVPKYIFALQHSYDINGSWAPGVLQVVVQNSNDKTLEANVTVEPVE